MLLPTVWKLSGVTRWILLVAPECFLLCDEKFVFCQSVQSRFVPHCSFWIDLLHAFWLCDWGMLSTVSLMIYNLGKSDARCVRRHPLWSGLQHSAFVRVMWIWWNTSASNEYLLEDSSSSSRTTSGICRRFGIFSKLQASLFGSDRPCRCYKSVKYGHTAVLQEACRLFRLLTLSNYFCGSLPARVPV